MLRISICPWILLILLSLALHCAGLGLGLYIGLVYVDMRLGCYLVLLTSSALLLFLPWLNVSLEQTCGLLFVSMCMCMNAANDV